MKDDQPSQTAEAVAFWRALEQRYPENQRILEDPYASQLLSRPVHRLLSLQRKPEILGLADHSIGGGTMIYTLLRHRWMEDAMGRAGGPWDQVLVLGAGYDMRAFRLAAQLGEAKVVEIDHPATGGRKARKVAKMNLQDRVQRVAVDFSKEDLAHALERAGFQQGRRSWFFWEGVSMYLPEAAVQHTLRVLRSYGCEGVLDFFCPASPGGGIRGAWHRFLPNFVSVLGEPVDFQLTPDKAADFLSPLGYRIQEVAGSTELSALSVRTARPNPDGWMVRISPDSGAS